MPEVGHDAAQVRCIACGTVCAPGSLNLRCAQCGDLLEIIFPDWKSGRAAGLDAAEMKNLWQQRRTSHLPIDESGVWRFRELLPALQDWHQAITLREGNTPLYELPRCARIAGIQQALRQASGYESDRLVQRYGHDGGRFFRAARKDFAG